MSAVFTRVKGRPFGYTHRSTGKVVFLIKDDRITPLHKSEIDYLVQVGGIRLRPILSTSQYSVSEYAYAVELTHPNFLVALAKHNALAKERYRKHLEVRKLEHQMMQLRTLVGVHESSRDYYKKRLSEERASNEKRLTQLKDKGYVPDFEIKGIPVFLIPKSGKLEGFKKGDSLADRAVRSYEKRESTFEPEGAVKGVMCHETRRVAWHMPNGLVVVDDYGPTLAIHIVRSPELASRMVSMDIAIVKARKDEDHLLRIEHHPQCFEEARSFIDSYAA